MTDSLSCSGLIASSTFWLLNGRSGQNVTMLSSDPTLAEPPNFFHCRDSDSKHRFEVNVNCELCALWVKASGNRPMCVLHISHDY